MTRSVPSEVGSVETLDVIGQEDLASTAISERRLPSTCSNFHQTSLLLFTTLLQLHHKIIAMVTVGSMMEPGRRRKRMIMYVSYSNPSKHIKLRYECTRCVRLLNFYLTDHVHYAAGARFDATMRHRVVIAFGPTMLHAYTKLKQPRMYQAGTKHHYSLEQSRKYNTANIAP